MASTVSNCSADLQKPTITTCPNGTMLSMLGDGACVSLPTFPTITTSGRSTTQYSSTLTSTDNLMQEMDSKMQFLSSDPVIGS